MTALIPNAALAYAVLDHIDAHPEQWNQGRWIGKSECGTVGCFAGWAVMLSGATPTDFGYRGPGGFEFTSVVELADAKWSVSYLAEKLLGTERFLDTGLGEGEDLFDEANNREDLDRLVGKIFGPRPEASYGVGCHCDWLGKGTPEHTPSPLCRSLRPDAVRES